jgi:hypothetical protein
MDIAASPVSGLVQQPVLMKNPAASSGVSSIEKKKSYGLFGFILGV